MQDFLTNLSTLYWWISVVVVGIILNVLSSYFRNGIDTFLSKFSGWWARRSDARRNFIETAATRIFQDEFERIEFLFSVIQIRIRMLTIFIYTGGYVLITLLARAWFASRDYVLTASFLRWFTIPIGLIGIYAFFTLMNKLNFQNSILNLARTKKINKVADTRKEELEALLKKSKEMAEWWREQHPDGKSKEDQQ